MVSALNKHPAASLTEGYYTATSLTNRLQVGYDWFAIREVGDQLIVESRHTLFGVPIPPQEARFELDRDWTPRRFEVRAEQLFSAEVEFGETETSMRIREASGEKELRAPVRRRRALFMLNGGLYFPLHAVRRFQFDNPQPQQFELFPEGVAEVRRMQDTIEEGRILRHLEMKVLMAGMEDTLLLTVNDNDDLIQYQTKGQNLLVKLEERGASC